MTEENLSKAINAKIINIIPAVSTLEEAAEPLIRYLRDSGFGGDVWAEFTAGGAAV
jgi:hypothetical protein